MPYADEPRIEGPTRIEILALILEILADQEEKRRNHDLAVLLVSEEIRKECALLAERKRDAA